MKRLALLLTVAATLCLALPLRAQQPEGGTFGVYKAGIDELIHFIRTEINPEVYCVRDTADNKNYTIRVPRAELHHETLGRSGRIPTCFALQPRLPGDDPSFHSGVIDWVFARVFHRALHPYPCRSPCTSLKFLHGSHFVQGKQGSARHFTRNARILPCISLESLQADMHFAGILARD